MTDKAKFENDQTGYILPFMLAALFAMCIFMSNDAVEHQMFVKECEASGGQASHILGVTSCVN